MSTLLGKYVRLTPRQLARCTRDPGALGSYIDGNDPPYETDLAPAAPDGAEPVPHGSRRLSVEKAWHGIHYLLTGEAEGGAPPLSLAVLGSLASGGFELAHGPPRLLSPPQVARLADALTLVPAAALRMRFDPSALRAAAIYPDIWHEGEDALNYLLRHYRELVCYFQDAARSGDGVVFYLD